MTCISVRAALRVCALLLLIPLIAPFNAAWSNDRIVSDNPITQYRNSGKVAYSPETYEGLQQLRRGHTDRAYAIWLEQGFQGDIEALALAAMLCKGEEIQPTPAWKMHWGDDNKGPTPACPVPARFWEESMIKMLGEGEGTFLLGLFGTELTGYDPFRKASVVYAPVIEAYMLRSALAGNPAGMYGAYLTGEHRDGERFTPPQNTPDVPVIPEKFCTGVSFEGRYWLSRAAHAGNLEAMEFLSREYRGKPPTVPPDVPQVEKYQAMAVAGGSRIAASILGRMYAKGNILPQDCAKAVYYMSIAAQLSKDNPSEKDRMEETLRIFKEGVVEGQLAIGDTQVITKPCLTEAEVNAIIERSKPAYEAAKAARDKDQAAHDALYEAARKKLPEIKAAYEAAIQAGQGKK